MEKPIEFFAEDISFQLDQENPFRNWIHSIITHFQKHLIQLNYIFASDAYVLKINKEYLGHDYFTDIVTFDQSESESQIEGDIFISIDRVKDNARQQGVPFQDELRRVMAHGVLHLIGFNDTTPQEKIQMREKEDFCLSLP